MKRLKNYMVILLIISITMSNNIYGVNHVVCEVVVYSEDSAKISLYWSDGSGENLRITGWNVTDSNNLVVYYDYGSNIPNGWNAKTISGDIYEFPMKVLLKAQGNEEVIFTDMPEDGEVKNSLLNLYYRSIINGYPDQTFRAENEVTRTEFAKMITTTADYEILQNRLSSFSDVSNSYWGVDYIMTLAVKDIFNGYPDGTFNPSGSISLGEVMAVINRTFEFYQSYESYPYGLEDHWSNEDFMLLVAKGIVKSTDDYYKDYSPNKKASREDCVILLSRVLEETYKTN